MSVLQMVQGQLLFSLCLRYLWEFYRIERGSDYPFILMQYIQYNVH